ncbi:MAG: RNA 3'-terminal phosphate cyclase [Candidatus Aenigmarchaeota archaeon]|nr:RNA 3'-terminal phosphate cyclase [Candidatus Aenigmarchaeota archaeon]
MIEINGAEGGGQILRTALALSAVTGEPCKVTNIRKGRPNPGMQAQHLEAANALAQLCNAEASGLAMHSTEIGFIPHEIKGGQISVEIPTAGSVSLVMQGIMIAALGARKGVSLHVSGGATHGKWAPPVTYVTNVLLPLIGKMGYEGYIDVENYGYYPRGGAEISCSFFPKNLKPVEILERGRILSVEGISHASKLLEKGRVAERQKKSCSDFMEKSGFECKIFDSYFSTSCGGSAVDLWIKTENSFLGADSLGERGKSAEEVGKEVAKKSVHLLQSGAVLDEHAEDQILPYMALAGSGHFRYHHLTQHTRTNISVIEKFLHVKFSLDEEEKIISCEKS